MAHENTPMDNAVAERFMRTLKEYRIYNLTLEEGLFNSIALNSKFSLYRVYLNKSVKSLNSKPNKKSKIGPRPSGPRE